MSAESMTASERESGVPVGGEVNADSKPESDSGGGVPSRYIDAATARLRVLSASFEDIQESRKRAANRGDEFSTEALHKLEDQLGRQLGKAVEAHPLGEWLAERKGLGGPRTGRVIACIGDPRRFPGQRCSEGHTLPPQFMPGSPCPVLEVPRAVGFGESEGGPGAGAESVDAQHESESRPSLCPGVMLEPRPHTGTRSLWHYAGLHAPNGQAARRLKGVQSDWSPLLRTLCVGPKGLADQIVLHRTEPYRTRYDEVKAAKLVAELPAWRAHKIARTVAVKAFLGDLLTEWKRIAQGGVAVVDEIDCDDGSALGG